MLNGKTFCEIKMAEITYRIPNHAVRDKTGSLIDRGVNGGLTGTNVLILSKTGRFVDVSGTDNN